jgi:hypothetical protein
VFLEEEFEDTKRGNHNPYIKEEQTTQWPKEKIQKDKQRSTKHTHTTKKSKYAKRLLCTCQQIYIYITSYCFVSTTENLSKDIWIHKAEVLIRQLIR